MTRGDQIAEYLAGTGRPRMAGEIADELGIPFNEVFAVLVNDGRFTIHRGAVVWGLAGRTGGNESGQTARSVSRHDGEAGSALRSVEQDPPTPGAVVDRRAAREGGPVRSDAAPGLAGWRVIDGRLYYSADWL